MSHQICSCGQVLNKQNVVEDRQYSAIGWFLLIFGITVNPIKILYKCRKCGCSVKNLSNEE